MNNVYNEDEMGKIQCFAIITLYIWTNSPILLSYLIFIICIHSSVCTEKLTALWDNQSSNDDRQHFPMDALRYITFRGWLMTNWRYFCIFNDSLTISAKFVWMNFIAIAANRRRVVWRRFDGLSDTRRSTASTLHWAAAPWPSPWKVTHWPSRWQRHNADMYVEQVRAADTQPAPSKRSRLSRQRSMQYFS